LEDAGGLVERYEIVHPSVPVEAEGMTILHLTDFHVRRPVFGGEAWPGVVRRLAAWLPGNEVDVVAMTGDYADHPRDEEAAAGMLGRLVPLMRGRLGVYGIFGNHDGPGLVRRAREVAGVRWLGREAAEVGRGVEAVGASFPEDLVGATDGRRLGEPAERKNRHGVPGHQRPFRIALVHYPTEVYTAAAIGIDVVLAGHTHGGQVRWSPTVTPHTSSDLPSGFASGMYRLGGTVLCVSRGLGEAVARVRVRCPAQACVYTLRRGDASRTERLTAIVRW
jgi:predicted MPP superfamily phosphohydrolase